MPRPVPGTYSAFFQRYLDNVQETEIMDGFRNQWSIIESFFDSIDEHKANTAYAPGKWTLKDLLQHVIDAERIFNYRALSFARGETASLPGFDENTYASNAGADKRLWKDIVAELKVVRRGTELMYQSFPPLCLEQAGIANNNPSNANIMGFITLGHFYHHKKIIEERYL